jgi:hypothetical protein
VSGRDGVRLPRRGGARPAPGPPPAEASLCANRLPGLEALEARRGAGPAGRPGYDAEQRARLGLDFAGNRAAAPPGAAGPARGGRPLPAR